MGTVKVFLGVFKRFKAAGLLNIFGLAVAFTAFTVIAMQLVFELGYDRCYKNADHIFRFEVLYPVSFQYIASAPEPVGAILKTSCPLVKDYFICSGKQEKGFRLKEGNNKFKERMVQAMPSMVDILGMRVIAGDGKQALTEPGMLMIAESISRKWFGTGMAVGKQVFVGDELYTVAAVYEDLPGNTIFKNYCYTRYVETGDWSNWNGQLFVSATTSDKNPLQKWVGGMKIETLDQIFDGLHRTEQRKEEGKSYLRVSALTDIYYDNAVGYDSAEKGNRKSSLILLGVGVLIIVIAGINFVNFSMSLAPTRMREINTRKVMGATVGSLRRGLVGEAVLYSLTAFVVSLLLLQILSTFGLEEFLSVSPRPLEHLFLVSMVGVLAALIGVAAGIYPAFYMTSFEPALVLKGSFVMTPKGIYLRNGLMFFQFTISIILITCTLLMGVQNRFMQNYSLGFSTEHIGWFKLDESFGRNSEAIVGELAALPEVSDYTFGDCIPGGDLTSNQGTEIDGEAVGFDVWRVYKNFLQFFDMKLVKGDTFSGDRQEPQLIFNETAVKKYPVLERYFGRCVTQVDSARFGGVAKDVNYLSLRNGIDPLAIVYTSGSPYRVMFVKLTGEHAVGTVEEIKDIYERLAPEGIFEFNFLDETVQRNYKNEQRLSQIILSFGGIAIVLALVGVYGLVVFNAQYKRKEIGLRKVNGATEKQIMVLLNRSFFRLLVVAFVVACPLAWYAMSRWLESFAYKTVIHWWIFLLAGAIIFVISLLTVSWHSWRAATENPVKSLKSE